MVSISPLILFLDILTFPSAESTRLKIANLEREISQLDSESNILDKEFKCRQDAFENIAKAVNEMNDLLAREMEQVDTCAFLDDDDEEEEAENQHERQETDDSCVAMELS